MLAVLLPLLAALFAALLSGTVAIPALPAVTAELGGGSVGMTWIITVALLANATTTPVWGSISDRYDTRLLVQAALLTLTAGSMVSACAPALSVLLAGRVVQGIGLGGVVAVTVAVLGALIPPREQGRYSGYGAVVMAVSMAGGPLLGGALVDTPLGWRACFLVPAAPAAVALVALRRRLKPRPRHRPGLPPAVGAVRRRTRRSRAAAEPTAAHLLRHSGGTIAVKRTAEAAGCTTIPIRRAPIERSRDEHAEDDHRRSEPGA
ncbi:MFS transporter [Rhodococcus rhodochrous]|nr:MFS transporter [Rhodococcus rhodochrous]QOH56523.1 hypothetical protein C6Y44_11555 [Rhodococcus rhodochrous]